MSLKLNLGAGNSKIEGYTPIDIRSDGVDVRRLPYDVGSVDGIRASHILEHFSFGDAQHALREWARVLKPGGELLIATPDLDLIAKSDDPRRRFWLMGGQLNEHDYHRSCYDRETLTEWLNSFGFCDVRDWSPEEVNGDTATDPISLRLKATRTEKSPQVTIKIAAICSIPRLGWNDHWGCIVDAFNPLRIPVRRFTGAYYGQCMQGCLEQVVKDGLDWVICLDYDTMFTTTHVSKLLDYMGKFADVDAIAPIQLGRQRNTPLLTIKGKTSIECNPHVPLEVDTAHFGLTVIRVDALKDTPKPWFMHQPDEHGSWGDGRTDDDIWFWRQFKKAGHKVFVAPDVIVGHLEVMVGEFDPNTYESRHVSVPDWLKRETGRDIRWRAEG